uniref:SGS domain-containing protein n=1 Tax=Strigamia maritima TaxID=126957 RepID=T1IZC0_STRMM
MKKAMKKSFVESGGTVLSTNWDEVRKEKFAAVKRQAKILEFLFSTVHTIITKAAQLPRPPSKPDRSTMHRLRRLLLLLCLGLVVVWVWCVCVVVVIIWIWF